MSSPEVLKKNVDELASLLGISNHPNPTVTLSAIDKYLKESSTRSSESGEGVDFTLHSFDLGITSTGNEKVDDAIRLLRLLHVNQQRELQTQINELLASVQKVTANPKADLKLGKMGR